MSREARYVLGAGASLAAVIFGGLKLGAGFVLGILAAPFVYWIPLWIAEDYWTNRKRAEYGPPFKSQPLEEE